MPLGELERVAGTGGGAEAGAGSRFETQRSVLRHRPSSAGPRSVRRHQSNALGFPLRPPPRRCWLQMAATVDPRARWDRSSGTLQRRVASRSPDPGPQWTHARGGIVPRGHFKGGLPHGVRILGQRVFHSEPFLAVAPSLGHSAGDAGVFYLPREVVNREFKYGTCIFRDAAHARADAHTLLGRCSDLTCKLVELGQEVDNTVAFLSMPSLRQGPLRRHRAKLLPLLKQMPRQALWTFRGAGRAATQRDDECLSALRRLYRGGFTSQIGFFWEYETTPAVRQWLLNLTAALREAQDKEQQAAPLRRTRSAAQPVKHALQRHPSGIGGAGQLRGCETPAASDLAGPSEGKPASGRRSSVLHLKNSDRRSVLQQRDREQRRSAETDRQQQHWAREQRRKSDVHMAAAKLAEDELMRRRAPERRLPQARRSRVGMQSQSAPSRDVEATPSAVLATSAFSTSPARAVLALPQMPGQDRWEAVFFTGGSAAVIDIESRRLLSPMRSLRGHPLLPGFSLPAGVDAVAWRRLGEDTTCYLFAQGAWVEFDAKLRRVTLGPHLISLHPLFRGLPSDYHSGVDCVVCKPASERCYAMKGRQCIEWDIDRAAAVGARTTVGVDGPFKELPGHLAFHGIEASVNRSGMEVYLISRHWCVLWDLGSQTPIGSEFMLSDTRLSPFACLPAHATLDPAAMMVDISTQLAARLPTDAASRPVLWPRSASASGGLEACSAPSRPTTAGEACDQLESELLTSGIAADPLMPLRACTVETSSSLQLLCPEPSTLLIADHGLSPWGALQSTGVLRAETPGSATITFTFDSPTSFGYVQVCGQLSADAKLYVDASPDGVSWQHVATVQQWACVGDAWWAEQHMWKHWRIAAESLKEGDVFHRVHWHTVVWAPRHVCRRVLEVYIPKAKVCVSGSAPVLSKLHAICPNVPSSSDNAVVAWPRTTQRGWFRKHCLLPLLNDRNRPSDMALFMTGRLCVAWSHSERSPMDSRPTELANHPLFRGVPEPFCEVGMDAIVYASPDSTPSLVYLLSDDQVLLWDMQQCTAVSSAFRLSSTGAENCFRALPVSFRDGVHAGANLFHGESNDVAFFHEGHVVYWSLDTEQVVQGPVRIGAPTTDEDVFAGLPASVATDRVLALSKLPGTTSDFVLFFSGEWLRVVDGTLVEGPYGVTSHKRFIRLPSVLGWNSLETDGWLMFDLRSAARMFLGIRLLSVAGRDSRASFLVQWSDDRTDWTTVGTHEHMDGWGKLTWNLRACNSQAHRFWRLLLPMAKAAGKDAAFSKLEWLVLPTKPLECVPASVITEGALNGATEQLFSFCPGGEKSSIVFDEGVLPSVSIDLGQPVCLARATLTVENGWSGEWGVEHSEDGVEWVRVATVRCVNGRGETTWDPFVPWQHWQVVVTDADDPTAPVVLTGIMLEQYSGPLADSEDGALTPSSAVLLMESRPGIFNVPISPDVDVPEASLTYDFQTEPQAFTRVAFVTSFVRGQRGHWLVLSSGDGVEFTPRARLLQNAALVEGTWSTAPSVRYWRLTSVDGPAVLESIQWHSSHTSLGTTSAELGLEVTASAADDGTCDEDRVGALTTPGNDAQVFSYDVTHPTGQAGGPAPFIAFTVPMGAAATFIGVSVRTAQNPLATWAVQVSNAAGTVWTTVAQHQQDSSEWCRTGWAHAGKHPRWRLLLTEQLEKCSGCWYYEVQWQVACHVQPVQPLPPHRAAGPLLPRSVCSDGVEGDADRLWQWSRKEDRPTVTLPAEGWIEGHFAQTWPFVKLRVLAADCSPRSTLLLERSVDGETWAAVPTSPLELNPGTATSARWPWSGSWRHWRVTASAGCSVHMLLFESEVQSRGPPLLERLLDRRSWRFGHGVPEEPWSADQDGESGMEVVAAQLQEARNVSKKLMKLSRLKTATGFELHVHAQDSFADSSLSKVMDIVGPLFLKDFKSVRGYDSQPPSEAPRVEYRAALFGDSHGLSCQVTVALRWVLALSAADRPTRPLSNETTRSAMVFEASDMGGDWRPIATFPNCPGLLYDCPPSPTKCLLVASSHPVRFDQRMPLAAPSGVYAFGLTSAVSVQEGTSVVTELAAGMATEEMLERAQARPLLRLLRALLPDGAATAVFHAPQFDSTAMTLSFSTGPMRMDGLPGANTGPVRVVVEGDGEGITGLALELHLEWVLQGKKLEFTATGEGDAEDGTVHLHGPLQGGIGWTDPHSIRGAVIEDVEVDIELAATGGNGPVAVVRAGMAGTLVIDGVVEMRCRADVRGAEVRLTAHAPLLTAPDVLIVASALAPSGGPQPDAGDMPWIPHDLRLEDATLSSTQGSAGVRSELRGRLRMFGESGDCRVECRAGAALLRAGLPRAVVGPLHLSAGASASAINAEVMLAAQGHVLLTARASVAGVHDVPVCVCVDRSGARCSVSGDVGGHPALHATLELKGSGGSASCPTDFEVTGNLDRVLVERELRELLLQVPVIQYIAAAALQFTLRLDSVTLEPSLLLRPTLCAHFVGVLMGADFDMLATVDHREASSCLPVVASKLVEQCWGSLLPLYREFAAVSADEETGSAVRKDASELLDHGAAEGETDATALEGIDWW
eukprot:TRINITY_DN553_c0_g3_i2.p1 TRINITY_DN553_c0_g3~~TRINITY_DN553_c0_g3_i2.p1  ORF type:complete len:2579 (+),score=561.82 TRINITY_DN553_c0_g3_i2:1496-9232(+)